jgi:hypothetical protein
VGDEVVLDVAAVAGLGGRADGFRSDLAVEPLGEPGADDLLAVGGSMPAWSAARTSLRESAAALALVKPLFVHCRRLPFGLVGSSTW